jgi:tetratricopeptide (TPR) repeat protein
MRNACGTASLVLIATCLTAQNPELKSPLGREFHSLPDEKSAVAAAEKALAEHPTDVKLILKLAQAHASVWEDKEAVAACTRGLKIDPNNADLLLERGHRELPLRQFTAARDDLKRAAELDPKMTEAYYHLGLAHYFVNEFAPAADAFCKGRDLVTKQDDLVNFTNWCYVALRRAGKKEEAAKALEKIPTDMQSNPGHTIFYFNLVRFYQGRKTESEILPPAPTDPNDHENEMSFDTISYQIGNWYLYNGDAAKAKEYFARVSKGNVWVTWGFVGSELELAGHK